MIDVLVLQVQKKLDDGVFHSYSTDDVIQLLLSAGFSNGIDIQSKKLGSSELYCVVAIK